MINCVTWPETAATIMVLTNEMTSMATRKFFIVSHDAMSPTPAGMNSMGMMPMRYLPHSFMDDSFMAPVVSATNSIAIP